jgi:thiol-disulfide isomerase/thioredoxin
LGRPQLLVFWNPGCPFCRELAEHFTAWDAASTLPELVVVAAGQPDAAQEILGQRRCVTLADRKSSVATLYGVTGVPSAVLLDFEGHIASSLAVGSKHILALAGLNAR